jgi:hypothetical protein
MHGSIGAGLEKTLSKVLHNDIGRGIRYNMQGAHYPEI